MTILTEIQSDDSETPASQNDKLIEVILSIMGNCTYKSENCAIQAFENNVSEVIISILNNNTDNDSIMTKACRLIGNLAQYQKIALNLQSKGLALATSNLLSEEASRSMLTMAVRVIRLMWQSKRFRFEIISFGSLHKIMIILHNVLKSECTAEPEIDSDVIILKRKNEPDRTISREKLGFMIDKLDKQEVEITYEIQKPPKRKSIELQLPKDRDSLDLVNGIVKCIHTLTASSTSQVARSVYADGLGIECLIYLCSENSTHRAMSLNILSNLSSNTLSQEYLAINNELVSNVAEMLLRSDNLDDREKRYCLNILCFSTENACNRGKMRRSGVFKSLLSIAHTSTNDKELALLIFAFYNFRYDEMGLNALLELGFIHIMIKILGSMLDNKEVDHIKFDDPSLDEERKEEQRTKQKKRPQTDVIVNYPKYPRYDPGSPSSSSSSYTNHHQTSVSSGYSPFNSPCRSYYDCEDSNSDAYSPVCSDNEEDEKKVKENDDFNILNFIYENNEIGREDDRHASLDMHDDEASNMSANDKDEEPANSASVGDAKQQIHENIPETLKQIQNDPINFILQLIWQVSISNGDSSEFVRPGNLLILHRCCTMIAKPHGKLCKILENVLTQTRSFVAILKQNFVFNIYELSSYKYDHQDCYSCSKMKSMSRELLGTYGTVAQSGYGRGELVHFLLTADDEQKKMIAVNLIYIISCSEILNDMLFRFKVLDIVIDVILNGDTMALEACDGLTVMSQNLNIHIPSEDDVLKRIIPDEFVEDEQQLMACDGDKVKFVTKNGTVEFSKESLKQASEVFNSMLSGDFRENNENEIKFMEYTVEGMRYFYQILKMSEAKKLKVIAPRVDDMSVILQCYELSILYILNDLQKPLLNVIKVVLDETNVMKIFEWSLKNINQDLLISAICYFLCGQIESGKKLKLFDEANRSMYSKEWRKLIVDVITMKCQPTLE